MIQVSPDQAQAIARHMSRLCKDVIFYTSPAMIEQMAFVDLVEKDKDSDWPFVDKSKIDAEMYIYTVYPEPTGLVRIHARGVTNIKKGFLYRVIEVIDRTHEGFGFVCSLEEIKLDG